MITVEKEPEDSGELEECCFCRVPTPYWTKMSKRKDQVACCEECAKTHRTLDVPSKKDWVLG